MLLNVRPVGRFRQRCPTSEFHDDEAEDDVSASASGLIRWAEARFSKPGAIATLPPPPQAPTRSLAAGIRGGRIGAVPT